MSITVFVALCAVGGLGAAARFIADRIIRARFTTGFPVATLAINLAGSCALGVLVGATYTGNGADLHAIVGTGFLGGFTTFSTHAVETCTLGANGSRLQGAVNVAATLIGALLLAWLGITIGRGLT